ncbi:MAG: patatin [Campylobacteraceae bacterium 4484_166]|nr:MAG: patatin [Campylobacteraceae bacterium 4484_166]
MIHNDKIEKKTISLVLGSGGARGYAHIGAIEELQKQGYEIGSISGSSMGALVGALYACGKLEQFKKWVLTLDMFDVVKLVDFSLTSKGIIRGDKLFDIINDTIGKTKIEDLPISYTAVATDIIKQKEIWLQKGLLLDAVRASVAIPSILTPKEIAGRYLIDGGVLNPLPVAPTISDSTDLTIAVSLNGKNRKKYNIDTKQKVKKQQTNMKKIFFEITQKAEQLMTKDKKTSFDDIGMFDVMGKTIDIMQNSILESKMAGYKPDILIDIPNDACGFYEFNKAYDMIELGRIITKEKIKEIKDV